MRLSFTFLIKTSHIVDFLLSQHGMRMQSRSLLLLLVGLVSCLKFNDEECDYNLNQNKTAEDPLDYWGEWEDHVFHPSPSNWRFPFYTLFLDRFVNGDPTNDNANGTVFETDVTANQLRVGGDVAGLVDTLDYIQGMGIKVSPHCNT